LAPKTRKSADTELRTDSNCDAVVYLLRPITCALQRTFSGIHEPLKTIHPSVLAEWFDFGLGQPNFSQLEEEGHFQSGPVGGGEPRRPAPSRRGIVRRGDGSPRAALLQHLCADNIASHGPADSWHEASSKPKAPLKYFALI
jgi:hypothetical protein